MRQIIFIALKDYGPKNNKTFVMKNIISCKYINAYLVSYWSFVPYI